MTCFSKVCWVVFLLGGVGGEGGSLGEVGGGWLAGWFLFGLGFL